MKILTPRHSFSLEYTPKQWVGLSNTFLLLLVTIMCGTVIYEIYNINKRFTTMLDSSVVTIDIFSTNFIRSKVQPFWKEINSNISVYSSFFKTQYDDESIILIIGSILKGGMHNGDLRCLIKYSNEEDITIVEAYFEEFSYCSTLLVYCPTKSTKIPNKVVLISYKDTYPKKWIEVEQLSLPRKPDIMQSKIAACVQPLNENVSIETIQEFIDFYETIGLSSFYLYDYNAPEDTVDFIHEFIDNGHSINFLQWNKKAERLSDCPFSGQEYIQDCLHRALGKFSYVITVDVADYLFLGQYSNIDDLLESYRDYEQLEIKRAPYCDMSNQNLAHLSFKNVHFVGSFEPSRTNFFFRPDEKAAITFLTPSAKKGKKHTEFIPELEGVIGYFSEKC